MKKITQQETVRLNKLQKILELGFKPFLSNRKISLTVSQVIATYQNQTKDELEKSQTTLQLAGKLMLRRGRFLVIRQNGESVQL